MTDRREPVAGVDTLVDEFGSGVAAPAIRRRHVVLVTGPWLAGSSSVTAALRHRLPDVEFVGADELRQGEAPLAVVFVVSAAAPLTASDCAVLDAAAAHTDVVIAAVSKIDVHRTWREVLDADRAILRAHAARYHLVPWVGVAAAPDLGDPRCDALTETVDAALGDDTLPRRNQLRAWETRLESTIRQYENAVDSTGRDACMAALRDERVDAMREQRMVKSERTIALRSQAQQARVQLSYFVRNRCRSIRTELQEDAAELTARGIARFELYAGQRVRAVIEEVDGGITEHLHDMAHELRLPPDSLTSARPSPPDVGRPLLKSRRVETRLMTVLGAGFGFGVALALSRLFADLAPGLAVAGAIGCAVIGVAVTVWIVGTRGLLHDRAVLDRWVGDVIAALRTTTDQMVASRVLAAEMAMTSALTQQLEERSGWAAERIRAIDAELREHTVARTRAASVRDRQTPAVRRAVGAVRGELGQPQRRNGVESVGPGAVTAPEGDQVSTVAVRNRIQG
jgi:hypothetical protein